MPLFRLRNSETRHGMWVIDPVLNDFILQDKYKDDPNVFHIRNLHDLPNIDWSKRFFIAPEIENQGKHGMYHFLRAFLNDHRKNVKDYYIWFFTSQFSDEVDENNGVVILRPLEYHKYKPDE